MSPRTAPLFPSTHPIPAVSPSLFFFFRLSLLLALAALAACAGPAPTHRGEAQAAPMAASEVGQSDVNRMATLGMRDNLESLLRLADKLYRRNPTEWRKTSPVSREAALAQLRVAPIVRKRECQCSVSGNVVAGSPDSMPEHSVK